MPRVNTSWMRGAINSNRSRIAHLQRVNADISNKIARLEAARSSVDGIYDDDKSFVAWIGSHDVGASWQGTKREEFEEAKRSAKSQGDSYCNGVNEIYHAICNKITQLENERAEGLGAISWAYQSINSLQNQINYALRNAGW